MLRAVHIGFFHCLVKVDAINCVVLESIDSIVDIANEKTAIQDKNADLIKLCGRESTPTV